MGILKFLGCRPISWGVAPGLISVAKTLGVVATPIVGVLVVKINLQKAQLQAKY
jgi:hypothetical protein